MPIKVQDDLQQQAGAVQRCVCWGGGGGTVWFGAKCFEMLSFCHRIISDPNQSPSDISSDVLLKIILSPVHIILIKFYLCLLCSNYLKSEGL